MRTVRGTPKHLSKTGKLEDFTYLMLNLDFSCNYRCSKCFNQGKDAPKYPDRKYLTLKEWLLLIQQANEMGGKAVVIAGEGEPTIHKDIKPIISEINSRGMIPIIYSNGNALSELIVNFYKENNVVIIISLDSLKSEKYDKLTGTKGQLKKVIENVQKLRELYKETITNENSLTVLNLAVNMTLSSFNKDEIANIKAFCGEDIYFICNPLTKLGKAVETWNTLISNNQNPNDFSGLIQQMSETGGPLTLGNNNTCNYSSNGIGVSPWGHYMTCAYTNLTNDLLGDIKNKSLSEAYKYKHKLEKTHYDKFGISPCLIRSPHFQEYLFELKGLKD